MLVRFTDFYAIAHDNSLSNANWNLLELFCANIQNEDITYLKPLKFEYYDFNDEEFNCMIYDKDKFKTFNLNMSYEDFYTNAVIKFIKKAYNKFQQKKIKFIFDDNILKVFGKDLYKNSIKKSIKYLEEKYKINIVYEFSHIINIAFGEVISVECGFNSCYHLYSSKYTTSCIFERNEYAKLIDKEVYNKLKLGESVDNIKYPVKAYIVDKDIQKYHFKPAKYLTIVDFNAHKTYYYTYSIINSNVSLYNIEEVDLGFMDIIEWIYNKSDKSKPIGFKFKSLISNLCHLDRDDLYINKYNIEIKKEDFYDNSPLKIITEKIVQIKHEILKKHRYDKKVIFRYNIENVVDLKINNVELKQVPFNGQNHKIIEQYYYLNKYLQNDLRVCGSYTCDDLVDKITGSDHIQLDIKLSDVGYTYHCELNEELNKL